MKTGSESYSSKTQGPEKKHQLVIIFALITIVAAPVSTVFLVNDPTGETTLKVSSYTIAFWVFILGLKFVTIIIGMMNSRKKKLSEAINTPKNHLLKDENSINPDDLNELLNRLVIYNDGNLEMLKKMYRGLNRGITLLVLCLYSFVFVTPFMLLGYANIYTPMYLIGGIIAFWVLLALRDVFRGDQNIPAQALGLFWNKEANQAYGNWSGREIYIQYEYDSVVITYKKQISIFKAQFKNKHFSITEAANEPQLNFFSTLHKSDLWNNVTVSSNGSNINLIRKYQMVDGTPVNDYWLADLWLLASL